MLLFAEMSLYAQSTNPDRPTVLTQKSISLSFSKNMKYYYTFILGEGDFKFTADASGGGYFNPTVLDIDFKSVAKLDYWDCDKPSKRTVSKFSNHRKQKVILLIETKGSGGSLNLKMEGPIFFESFGNNEADAVSNNPSSSTSQNANSKMITVVLKDGRILTGPYESSSIIRNGISNKLSMDFKGKKIPNFNINEVTSITIQND